MNAFTDSPRVPDTVGPARRRRLGAWAVVLMGAVLLAVGVGLVPHVIKAGFTVTSALSLVLIVGGIVVTAMGARAALRGRHLPVRVVGVAATLLVVLLAVAVVAPSVAATHVAPTEVGATPTEVGLEHESVTLHTADGVDLAGWYVPGTNGAGVVVLHGSGSTRSSVLDQAAALVDGGYSVLLLDARGHGDSHGTAMDFGWNGDLDVAAGIDHLSTRPEVEPDRVGVVGFSMGGEEAIGAAGSDPRIRAVVAEGATARRSSDKAWLSDVYGWRGAIQERIEAAQYGVTDLLTAASPPTPLRTAVAGAPDTRFLLITVGNVDDEGRAAAHIRSGSPDQVEVWTVGGAGHTGGFDAGPAEWQRRVVGFLDRTLD